MFAVPANAKAAAPAFGNTNCYVQSVTMGGNTVWQIKGVTQVNNLPAGMTTVMVTVTFQKKANGAAIWV